MGDNSSTPDAEPAKSADNEAAASTLAALESLTTGSLTESDASATEATETQQPAVEETKKESVADVLARMQVTPSFDDEPQTENSVGENTSFATTPEPTATPAEPVAAPAAKSSEGGSDVQDYMNSLLQRLNKDGSPTDDIAGVAAPVAPAPQAEVEVEVEAPVVAAVENVPQEPLNPEDYKPKRVAPEKKQNLAAMRELAIESSRSAVKRSEIKKRKQAAGAMLLGAGGSIAGAIVCAMMSQQTGDSFYLLAIVLFLVTVVCSGLYAKTNLFTNGFSLSELKSRLKSGSKPASPSVSPAASTENPEAGN